MFVTLRKTSNQIWRISQRKMSTLNRKSDENQVKLVTKQLILLEQVFEVLSIYYHMYRHWAICAAGQLPRRWLTSASQTTCQSGLALNRLILAYDKLSPAHDPKLCSPPASKTNCLGVKVWVQQNAGSHEPRKPPCRERSEMAHCFQVSCLLP